MPVDVKALLKQVPSVAYLYGAIAVLAVGTYQGWAYHQREIGKREVLIANLEVANRDLRHTFDSLSKQYRVDTVRVRVTRTRVDTMTQTVEQWKHDTLKVVEYVTKAAKADTACTQALLTCDERVGVAQRGWDGARAEIKALKASMPSKLAPWRYGLLGASAAYLLFRVTK